MGAHRSENGRTYSFNSEITLEIQLLPMIRAADVLVTCFAVNRTHRNLESIPSTCT